MPAVGVRTYPVTKMPVLSQKIATLIKCVSVVAFGSHIFDIIRSE